MVIRNTLPKGLGIDAISRRANLAAPEPLRFVGRGRRITFRIGTVPKGGTVVVSVNAKVEVTAPKGTQVNTVSVQGRGLPRLEAGGSVTVR